MDAQADLFNALSGLGLAEAAGAAVAAGAQLVTFPRMSDTIAAAFAMTGAALINTAPMPIGIPQVNVTKRTFWHTVAADAATTRAYKFFNANSAPFVSNMPQPGILPADNGFWLTNIRAFVRHDGAAALSYTRLMIDWLRNVYENSENTLKVGDRTVIDRLPGLFNFPSGGGVDYSGLIQETPIAAHATAPSFAGGIRNGLPSVQNKFEMVPTPIPPGKTFSFTAEWAAVLGAFTGLTNPSITIALDGYLVNPSNN